MLLLVFRRILFGQHVFKLESEDLQVACVSG